MPTFASVQDLIRRDHEKGVAVLKKYGVPEDQREPVEVALAVEEHRWAWKPPEVKLILVAESHVFTSPADMALEINVQRLPAQARHAPSQYMRLVYCLGYGESDVLMRGRPEKNNGTPQFWKLFGSLAGAPPMPLRSGGGSLTDRLRWKVNALSSLAAKGVWLLDASLHGIYSPGGDRSDNIVKKELHGFWLEGYGGAVLGAHSQAVRWIIGKTVCSDLRELGFKPDGCILQPQGVRGKRLQEEQRVRFAELLDRLYQLTLGDQQQPATQPKLRSSGSPTLWDR